MKQNKKNFVILKENYSYFIYGYDWHVKDAPHCQFLLQEHTEHGLWPTNLSCIPARLNTCLPYQSYQTNYIGSNFVVKERKFLSNIDIEKSYNETPVNISIRIKR